MGKAKSSLTMEIDIKEIILMDYLMDMENMYGRVEHNFRDILEKDCVVEKEFGEDLMNHLQIFIREIMQEIKKMDMEFIDGLMEMNIEDNSLTIINMVMEK